jgi:CHASE3 domain sensor protein
MLDNELKVSKSHHIGKVSLIIVLCIVVFMALLYQLFQQHQKLVASHHWVAQTLKIDDAINRFMIEVLESGSAVRGYLLTSNKAFITNYQQAALILPVIYAELVELTQNNPTEQAHLQALQSLLEQRLQFFQLMLNSYRGLPPIELEKLISDSQQLTQTIKDLLSKMRTDENRLLTLRETQMQTDVQRALIWNVAVALVLALMGSFLAWSLFKEGRHRRQLLQEMASLNSQLETQNANLLAANIAVMEADRLKTEFLSAMSHES